MVYDLLQGGKQKKREVKAKAPLTKWFQTSVSSKISEPVPQPKSTINPAVVVSTTVPLFLKQVDSDTSHQSESEASDEEMEVGELVEVCLHPRQYIEQYHIIPFSGVSPKWYERQNMLAVNNVARERRQMESDVVTDKAGNLICINRSQAQGSLEDNINTLSIELSATEGNTRKHLEAILAVARYMQKNGPVLKTQELGKVYTHEKEQQTTHVRKRSIELYEMFSQHLNLLQIYVFDQAYLVPNSPQIMEAIVSLMCIIHEDEDAKQMVVKDVMESQLKSVYSAALKYLDSHRDRLILKGLMAELTSIRFTAKLEGILSRKGAISGRNHLFSGLQRYAEIRMTSQMVRSDMTTL